MEHLIPTFVKREQAALNFLAEKLKCENNIDDIRLNWQISNPRTQMNIINELFHNNFIFMVKIKEEYELYSETYTNDYIEILNYFLCL